MADASHRELPGCGLAVFAMLLLCIFTVGISGVLFSTYSILQSGNELTPRRLSYGGVVDPAMLVPLRDAGLIGPAEVPDAYHAENVPGTEACAISGGEVMRIGVDGNKSMPIASITAVTGSDTEVVIHGDTSIVCHFGADEGGERFRRMLENRDESK
ncbi:MAG: hypothetical protein Q8P18_12380 [Pseudomonadota bacterium]|nr:hypothetical protein [Pseudomonadota bacterium]